MTFDLSAAPRALEFLATLSSGLVTLHADFVLGFIAGLSLLRRVRRGAWDDLAYAGFLAGLTVMLLLGIVFLGLQLSIPEWILFVFGIVAAAFGWVLSGGLPPAVRRMAVSPVIAVGRAVRSRRTPVPDRLPPEIRSLTRSPRH